MHDERAVATTEKPAEPEKPHPFVGLVFHLDKFKGIGPGGWSVDWKAQLNRLVVLAIDAEPKDGWNPIFDLDAALAKLGYVKADSLNGLIEAARTALITVANNHPSPGSQACVDELTAVLKAMPEQFRKS